MFSIGLILISVFITSFISINVNLNNYFAEREAELLTYSKMISNSIAADYQQGVKIDYVKSAEEFSEIMGLRLTFIDKEGNVIADSTAGNQYKLMENHLNREEVQEAINTGQGGSSRVSITLGSEFLYVAHAFEYNGEIKTITRVAMEIDRIEMIGNFIYKSSLISSIVGIIVAAIFAVLFTNRLMKPINALENQLMITMEENRKAENIRKEFVANVTHELKTPLTSISGFVETLQDGAADNPQIRSKFLDIIAIETVRLKRLIEDILTISDIENKREINTDKDINVREAIEETIASIQPIIHAKNINIETHYAYEIYLGGNYDRFKQLMLNLIENAVKYSHNGGNVIIMAKKIDDEIHISVKDEGIGISQEHLTRLFERFYRVDESRNLKAGGTGLGLAIVKHIASLFNGEVKVESKLGEGSVFTVILRQ